MTMKTNRKIAETYRFNGHPYLDSASIHSVEIAELESRIKEFEAKLTDPRDPDDKKWKIRWLNRFQLELDKKLKGQALKERKSRERRP